MIAITFRVATRPLEGAQAAATALGTAAVTGLQHVFGVGIYHQAGGSYHDKIAGEHAQPEQSA